MEVEILEADGTVNQRKARTGSERQLAREQHLAQRNARILERRAQEEQEIEEGRQRQARLVLDKIETLEKDLADARKDITASKGEITKLKNSVTELKAGGAS